MGMRRYMTYNGMYNVPVYTLFGIFTVLIKDMITLQVFNEMHVDDKSLVVVRMYVT